MLLKNILLAKQTVWINKGAKHFYVLVKQTIIYNTIYIYTVNISFHNANVISGNNFLQGDRVVFFVSRLDQMFSDAFSKDHQLIRADPKHSLYLACALMVRGDVQLSDLRRNIERSGCFHPTYLFTRYPK